MQQHVWGIWAGDYQGIGNGPVLHVKSGDYVIWIGHECVERSFNGVSCMPRGKRTGHIYVKNIFLKLLGFRHILNIDCSVKCEQIKNDFIEKQYVRAEEK